MADEQLAIASEAPATPASEPAAPTADDRHEGVETILEPGEEPAPESATPQEIEVVEIEWDDGNKYQIPKALESGILKNKDYTQKAQAVAATRKELEARAERIAEQAKAVEAEASDRGELHWLNSELKKYEGVDWRAWWQQDPGAVQEAKFYVEDLEKRKAATEGRLKETQTNRSREAQQDYAKRAEDTRAFAEKIQGWSPDIDNKIQAYVTEAFRRHGVDDAAIQKFVATNLSPAFYDLAHKAWIGEQTLSKPTAPPPKPPAPQLEVVKGNTAAGPQSLEDLSRAGNTSAFAKKLIANLEQRARR